MYGLYDNLPGDMLLEHVHRRQRELRDAASRPALLAAIRFLRRRSRVERGDRYPDTSRLTSRERSAAGPNGLRR
jgi:hypothetical protein